MRRLTAWGLSIPLILAGTQVAHSLAYRLAYPEADVRWRMLSASGHGYEGYLPVAAGVAAALCLVAILAGVGDALRRRPIRPVPVWMFALLPPLAFTVQEYTERWLHGVNGPQWMVYQPTFRYGLLLQLPFALLAFGVARLLCRVVVVAARILRGRGIVAGTARVAVATEAVSVNLPRLRADVLGWSLRGPPAYAVSS
ncbi:MAG TPA: hypothetical protein VMB53_05080 [Gaiellaceae bacterium]|nr:hypothetical protein [Gaiellaceae bacterium]